MARIPLPSRDQVADFVRRIPRHLHTARDGLIVGGQKCIEFARTIDHLVDSANQAMRIAQAIHEGRFKIEEKDESRDKDR
jgi:hypothetical protein